MCMKCRAYLSPYTCEWNAGPKARNLLSYIPSYNSILNTTPNVWYLIYYEFSNANVHEMPGLKPAIPCQKYISLQMSMETDTQILESDHLSIYWHVCMKNNPCAWNAGI